MALMPDYRSGELLSRLARSVESRGRSGNKQYSIKYSVGVAMLDTAGTESLDDLLSRADQAMYQNKKLKRQTMKTNLPDDSPPRSA